MNNKVTASEIESQIYNHLNSLPYEGGYPSDWQETLAKHLKQWLDETPSVQNGEDGWISVKDRLPEEKDTHDEFYNEVITLQHGRKRPTFMKYWEVKHDPFTHHWHPYHLHLKPNNYGINSRGTFETEI